MPYCVRYISTCFSAIKDFKLQIYISSLTASHSSGRVSLKSLDVTVRCLCDQHIYKLGYVAFIYIACVLMGASGTANQSHP